MLLTKPELGINQSVFVILKSPIKNLDLLLTLTVI